MGRAGGSASDLGGTQRTAGDFLKIPPSPQCRVKLLGVPEEDSLVLEIVVKVKGSEKPEARPLPNCPIALIFEKFQMGIPDLREYALR